MLLIMYFLLLLAASIEDYKFHKVRHSFVAGTLLIGVLCVINRKEDRWVTVALTCFCFLLLLLFYLVVNQFSRRFGQNWKLGGADVRLIPCMMLVQGWDVALFGVLCGLVAALLYAALSGKWKQELGLVPWMSSGCLFAEQLFLLCGQ